MPRLGSWWLAPLDALPDEQVVGSFPAKHSVAQTEVGGKLLLTDRRMVFLPSRLDAWSGATIMRLPWSEVRDAASEQTVRALFDDAVGDQVKVATSEGEELFVVNDAPGIVDTIRRRLGPTSA